MSLVLNSSGGGSITLQEPVTASSRTLTLPDENGTVIIADGSGNILSKSGSIGYGTGAGGTVTQSSSKTTAVTLNKAVGRIITNNSSLGASASASFTFNNSLIAATDLILVQLNTLGAQYDVKVYNAVAGAVTIRLTNLQAGSFSEAVTLNFAVIKGATS